MTWSGMVSHNVWPHPSTQPACRVASRPVLDFTLYSLASCMITEIITNSYTVVTPSYGDDDHDDWCRSATAGSFFVLVVAAWSSA